MTSGTYPLFILKNHRGFAVFSVIVIAAFQYLIIELMTSMDTEAFFGTILNQLPERLRVVFSENFLMRLSVDGAAAFGFNHPIVLALVVINAINIPTRHIAGEIESGTMEWLIAHPVKRTSLIITLWSTASLLLFLIICGAWIGSLSALAVTGNFSLAILGRMLQIGSNLWLLAILMMSLSMLISTFGKEGSKAGVVSAALILMFYFLHFLSRLWEFLDFIEPFNIFTYYQPQKLMFGERSFLLHACVLLVLITASLAISVGQFRKRDIPG